MSFIAAFAFSALGRKVVLHPLIGGVMIGLQVASFVADIRPKAPDIIAPSPSIADLGGVYVPTRTILYQNDALMTVSMVLGFNIAVVASLVAVLGFKGFFSSSSPSGRDPSDGCPLEPGDGYSQDDDITDGNGNYENTGNGEEPPQPPSLGAAAAEVPRKSRHWLIRLLLWFLSLIFQIIRAIWQDRWKLAWLFVKNFEFHSLVSGVYTIISYIGNSDTLWNFVARMLQPFLCGADPFDDLQPPAVLAADLLRQWWTTSIMPVDDLMSNEYLWDGVGEYIQRHATQAIPSGNMHPIAASITALLRQWWDTKEFPFNDLLAKQYLWIGIMGGIEYIVGGDPFSGSLHPVTQLACDFFSHWGITGEFVWSKIHPWAPLVIDILTGRPPVWFKIVWAWLYVFTSTWLLGVFLTYVKWWLLWVPWFLRSRVRSCVLLAILYIVYTYGPVALILQCLQVLAIGVGLVVVGWGWGITLCVVAEFDLVLNIVMISVPLILYARIFLGWPSTPTCRRKKNIILA
ncbi:hypothetical protein R3P38DRAFT_875305 [Favolaschia claudopus]|uniref:Uncharacterized protein n=1 Tax=Favolaschia claudopus TaxID=2862362 RepID=A0AAW0BTS2_9AGAR